ncbi:hypothetical protein SAMN05661086_00501 [Anaeromicropila populeti]|uniref:Uncharacterized protein n=1 Tax=Anaeromicropila populeti TaxID=37658 RepID=A0A1I6I7C8_9FIRM|nr:hypothetical protein SAMN05661086_00501 [Anaeromicropila populeti]
MKRYTKRKFNKTKIFTIPLLLVFAYVLLKSNLISIPEFPLPFMDSIGVEHKTDSYDYSWNLILVNQKKLYTRTL